GKRRDLDSSIAWVRALALSPDGRRLAVSCHEGAVALFDLGTGKQLWIRKDEERDVWGVAFSLDGKMLATADGRGRVITLWEVETGKERQTLKGPKWGGGSVAFAPDGKTLLSGAGDLFVWNSVTGKVKKMLRGDDDWFAELALSPDGKTLAAVSASKPY